MVYQKDRVRIFGTQPVWVSDQHVPARAIRIPIQHQVLPRIKDLARELRLQSRPQVRRHALAAELRRVGSLPLLPRHRSHLGAKHTSRAVPYSLWHQPITVYQVQNAGKLALSWRNINDLTSQRELKSALTDRSTVVFVGDGWCRASRSTRQPTVEL